MGGLAPPEVEVISLKRTDTQQKIMKIDPWLQNYASDIRLRMDRHAEVRRTLLGDHADLTSFANGYMYYGIHRTETGWVAFLQADIQHSPAHGALLSPAHTGKIGFIIHPSHSSVNSRRAARYARGVQP